MCDVLNTHCGPLYVFSSDNVYYEELDFGGRRPTVWSNHVLLHLFSFRMSVREIHTPSVVSISSKFYFICIRAAV